MHAAGVELLGFLRGSTVRGGSVLVSGRAADEERASDSDNGNDDENKFGFHTQINGTVVVLVETNSLSGGASVVQPGTGGWPGGNLRPPKCGEDILSAGSGGILPLEPRGKDAP